MSLVICRKDIVVVGVTIWFLLLPPEEGNFTVSGAVFCAVSSSFLNHSLAVILFRVGNLDVVDIESVLSLVASATFKWHACGSCLFVPGASVFLDVEVLDSGGLDFA